MENTETIMEANRMENKAKDDVSSLKAMISAINRSQAVIEFKLDGTVLEANDNFLKTLGYSLPEIKGRHHQMFCDPEFSQSPEYVEFWSKLAKGEFQAGEFKRMGKGGREVWIMASYNPVLGEDGIPYKVVKFATDITAAKAELKVRTDIMNLTSIVSESNLRGDILSVNEKFCEVSKYSKEELIGKPHNTTRHPDMPKEVFKELWSTIGRGKIFRGVVKNRAKDGTPYYVDAVIAPIMGDNGKPKKYLGVRYDITEAEIERQNMRGIFRAIDASFAYIEFDTQGMILSANKVFQEAMGYSVEELKNRHHKSFCEQSLVNSNEYAQFWENLRAGKPQSGIFKRLTKSGKEIWLQAVYSPVTDETGRVAKVVKIATDVTSQQKMIFSIQETATALSAASNELTATATEMTNTANRTNQESQSAAAASEQVATGVQTVATNMEEMVASIKEISRSTNESSQMAKLTMQKAQESNATIVKLGVSSQEIGDVIKVISSIAQQTNLLALNATIEAARAGEAGKGFAVVANEVKELAKQTAKATNDITNKIGAIQGDTKNAVEAIGGISLAVEKLNGIAGVIAAAVEEQTATTNEISRVVVESKKGVESIASTVRTVSMASVESTAASNQTLAASKELAMLAEKLNALVKSTAK
ncbi:MAG: PAS domain-containing methyl-accepting chemotaxis protein [Bdellovibrionales bacterium]|nr:PAS domain-containing methyl-accepting chemotaxis protein [Bdellovibrionales bacterium]